MNFFAKTPWAALLLCIIPASIPRTSCAATGLIPAPDSPVAVIGGKAIRYADVPPEVQQKLDLLQQQYESQVQELTLGTARTRAAFIAAQTGALVDTRVLEMEAAARKTTPAALLEKLTTADVTAAEMHAFYDSQKSQIGQPYENVEPQLRQFLQRQAAERTKRNYLDSLRAKHHASILLEPMREHIEAKGPQRGPDDAPVTIVEFSDFQCPFCARLEPVLARILKNYPSQVRLIYRNMPLPTLHPDATNAAAAAVCAGQAGKFWEMHDTLFAEQSSLNLDALREKAKRLGLDSQQFNHCLDSGQALAALKSDEQASQTLGLSATPVTFVNGRFVNGAVSYEELAALVEDELHRAPPVARR